MPKGITQEQVNAAADALVAASERPTVEKVRAQLGTGSPNTVTRMLDAWRNQLGERLRQFSALPDVPSPVGQAMMALWHLATEHSERAIAGRFAEERDALEAARVELAKERETWGTRLESAETNLARVQAAKDLAEHACATLDSQLQDSHALRADLAQQRDRLQALCDQQSNTLQALRKQIEELQADSASERSRQAAYVRTLEDRAHQEIDRVRQESKQWQQRLDATERIHREALGATRAEEQALRDQLRSAEKEVARYVGQVAGLERAMAKQPTAKRKKSTASDVSHRRLKRRNKQPQGSRAT